MKKKMILQTISRHLTKREKSRRNLSRLILKS